MVTILPKEMSVSWSWRMRRWLGGLRRSLSRLATRDLPLPGCTKRIFLSLKSVADRARDPDTHGSAFIFPPGSGSRWKKFDKKTEKIKVVKVSKFWSAPWFLINLFCLFHQQKIFLKIICYTFCKACSGSALKSSWIRIRIANSWTQIRKKGMQVHSPARWNGQWTCTVSAMSVQVFGNSPFVYHMNCKVGHKFKLF